MEVILKEDVPKLGSRGDVVKVAEGYGRNFLLPRKLAIEANAANKAVIEQMKAAAVRRSANEKHEAEALAKQFDGLSVSFQRRSGENDQLFGSVTSSDIAEALEKKSFHIDRRKKVCKFCVEKIESINYKDVRLLAQFVAESGKIVPRRLTGVCTPHQRRLSSAIKQARNIALLPFAGRAL